MAFSSDFLDELRGRIGLADTIARRVRLQCRGREHVGLCPFHNEKSPSFTVNEDKGFFHCFGCGAHGDVIGFVMRTENLSFPEAVERLAEQAGLEVPRASPEARAEAARNHTLHAAMEAACRWFEAQLRAPEGREGLAYLKRRGLKDETIARFRLGFAPEGRGGLRRALAAMGVADAQALELGLVRQPEGGGESYDYFRGRVVFPIADMRGRVIAFGGRVLGDGQPKYLNSPESSLFHKGRVLYGLAQALKSARERREAIVVEGYMDVIALHEAGITSAVAPLGTALTESQIELLWRLAPEPVLCFDGDAAGQRAMWRAAERVLPMLKPGHSLRFVSLPAGEDPDTLVRSGSPVAFAGLVEQARPLVDVVWDREVAAAPLDTPERRAELRRRVLAVASRIAERSVHEAYFDEFRARLDLLLRPPDRGRTRGRWKGNAGLRLADIRPRSNGHAEILIQRFEWGCLAALLRAPELIEEMGEELAHHPFATADLDRMRQAILMAPPLDSERLQVHLRSLGFADVLERTMSREVFEAAPFAHPNKTLPERRAEWLAAWGQYWRREICKEIDADRSALGADLTAERLARIEAKCRSLDAADAADQDADGADSTPGAA